MKPDELFREASWFSVLVGQNHLPRDYNPLIEAESDADNARVLAQQRESLAAAMEAMPDHGAVLERLRTAEPRVAAASRR